eukprot:12045098-Alexandrium_andersonii.AAC.1
MRRRRRSRCNEVSCRQSSSQDSRATSSRSTRASTKPLRPSILLAMTSRGLTSGGGGRRRSTR